MSGNNQDSSPPRLSVGAKKREECAGIGPILPPGFASRDEGRNDDLEDYFPPLPNDNDNSSAGDTGPANRVRHCDYATTSSMSKSPVRLMGPALPSGVESDEAVVIGPAIPSRLHKDNLNYDDEGEEGEEEERGVIGPVLPQSNTNDEALEYVRRLASFETKKACAASLKREEWMTELPEKMKKAYGLSAKTSFSRFSAGTDPSPSSGSGKNLWTATPNEKASISKGPGGRKPKEEKGLEAARSAERDRIEQQKADQLNEGRSESLFELHQRKRKMDEPTDEGKPTSRRPFNRDTDMGVRGFPSADAQETKKKLGTLCGRFAPSASKKFL